MWLHRKGGGSATQQCNSQLNLTVLVCFPGCLMLWVVSTKRGEEIGTCYQRLEARALKNTLHVLCGWPNRHGGLKVDSSVMHDSGTVFSANSTLVLLTARSAFYSLRSALTPRLLISAPRPPRHIISKLMGQQPVFTHLQLWVFACPCSVLCICRWPQ